MTAKFILIVVFVHGYGPRLNYSTLGEFETMRACQAAAAATRHSADSIQLMGHEAPRFICAAKQ